MTDRRPGPEWVHLMDYNNFRLASDPTRDLRTWCEWRVDVNDVICRDGKVSKTERIRELIKKTNKREQKHSAPSDSNKSRPTREHFLLVNFGLPRIAKTPAQELILPPGRPEHRQGNKLRRQPFI